ncbi:hypothetical protein [Citricoccus sp. CH26A]|uniref:hypothetical protein n=1 Tax=Citricoccus TaxID=169133 RepID=UPI001145665E|nr:hypothetical protein [Citricoccus sp. CH26A]
MEKDEQAYSEWPIYNGRQKFEHELIDRKISWFLTTQGILFAAYGITLDDSVNFGHARDFRTVVASIGLALSVATVVGVAAVINSKRRSFLAYRDFCKKQRIVPLEAHGGSEAQWGVSTPNTWVTLIPDVATPVLFIVGWLVVLLINLNSR